MPAEPSPYNAARGRRLVAASVARAAVGLLIWLASDDWHYGAAAWLALYALTKSVEIAAQMVTRALQEATDELRESGSTDGLRDN